MMEQTPVENESLDPVEPKVEEMKEPANQTATEPDWVDAGAVEVLLPTEPEAFSGKRYTVSISTKKEDFLDALKHINKINWMTWATMGMFIVEALKKMTKLPLDVHLMIQRPERYVDQFAKAGAEFLTVHPEAEGYPFGALDAIKKAGVKAGLALKPATPVSVVKDYLSYIDMLLIMTVNPGFSGQQMKKECLAKYKEARKLYGNDLLLEIDGGVMPENIQEVLDAGAQVIVAATAIFKTSDYGAAIKTLRC